MAGKRIVLTQDRSLMSNFRGNYLFGFISCGPYELIPRWAYDHIFCPAVEGDPTTGEAKVAECGVRRVEAALLRGYPRDQVLVGHPDYFDRAIGPDTKVVGVGVMDPLGIGPVTTSMCPNRTPYNHFMFTQLMAHVKRLKAQYGFRVVLGGAGAWQFKSMGDPALYGIDHVVEGEIDGKAADIFHHVEDGTQPRHARYYTRGLDEIPEILGPTVNSLVEVMRGCGRGCSFCDVTRRIKRDFSIDRIQREVRINYRYGFDSTWLHSDELLLYGCDSPDFTPNEDAVLELFRGVKQTGVRLMGSTHWTLSSVAAKPELIHRIAELNHLGPDRWLGVQPGLESAAPRIIREWLALKVKPYSNEEWPWVVREGLRILNQNFYFPAVTLIVGFPKETPEETRATIDLIEACASAHCIFAPLLYMDYFDKTRSMTWATMNETQFELFWKCWRHNLAQFSNKAWLVTRGRAFSPLMKVLTVAVMKLGTYAIFKYLEALSKRNFGKLPDEVFRTAPSKQVQREIIGFQLPVVSGR